MYLEYIPPHIQDKVLECSTELINSTKEAPSDIVSVQKCFAHKGNIIGGNSEALMKNYPKLEAETEKDNGNPPDQTLKTFGEDEPNDRSKELVDLPVMHEPPLLSVSGDESDESDIVEQDVSNNSLSLIFQLARTCACISLSVVLIV